MTQKDAKKIVKILYDHCDNLPSAVFKAFHKNFSDIDWESVNANALKQWYKDNPPYEQEEIHNASKQGSYKLTKD